LATLPDMINFRLATAQFSNACYYYLTTFLFNKYHVKWFVYSTSEIDHHLATWHHFNLANKRHF